MQKKYYSSHLCLNLTLFQKEFTNKSCLIPNWYIFFIDSSVSNVQLASFSQFFGWMRPWHSQLALWKLVPTGLKLNTILRWLTKGHGMTKGLGKDCRSFKEKKRKMIRDITAGLWRATKGVCWGDNRQGELWPMCKYPRSRVQGCYELTPIFFLYLLFLLSSCHVITMWSLCDLLFLWCLLFCNIYCYVTHCPGWLHCPCDTYCSCDSIVLIYYKY